MIRWRVVCALEVMMDRFSPTSLFMRVDLPTLGLPTILTNPDLCAVAVIEITNLMHPRYYLGVFRVLMEKGGFFYEKSSCDTYSLSWIKCLFAIFMSDLWKCWRVLFDNFQKIEDTERQGALLQVSEKS